MLRYASGDEVFPADRFSAHTTAGSVEHKKQFRLTGDHGLGGGFSLVYDLRYGSRYRAKRKDGVTNVTRSSGFEDEKVGIDYGLKQTDRFADALGIRLIIPGSSRANVPGFDSGHWAVEPSFSFGVKRGVWHLTSTCEISTRVFTDWGVAQFRTDCEAAKPVLRHLQLAGQLFLVRSLRLGSYKDATDNGELYNLFRLGVKAKYKIGHRLESFVGYERDIAGMGRHATDRVTVGLKIAY